MRYIPHTHDEIRQMLDVAGAPDIDWLFRAIPKELRFDGPLALAPAVAEQELSVELTELAARNANTSTHDWFLGAGTYAHYAPAAIDTLASRAEFLTAYTPYQPEISQGTLQAIFEWQSMISSLVGLEVANASMYDGASAAAEAALMAMRLTRRSKVVVAHGLHPHSLAVLRTYLSGLGAEISQADASETGLSGSLEDLVDDRTACVLVQRPNFYGCVEDLEPLAQLAHDKGALLVSVVSEALSLALLRAPGHCGADIACGEAQSFGVPMGFGGPHLGFLASGKKQIRQMPGRLAGQTVDTKGRPGFVLTLSTREQHIRRERATSNICTNQGLCLLMATIYLSLMGPKGLRKLAEINLSNAEYAKSRVRETPGLELPHGAATFNEFVVQVPDSGEAALARALAAGCVGGLDLSPYAPDLGAAVLVCTTELANRASIDRLVSALAGAKQ